MQTITINQLNDLLSKGAKLQAIVTDTQMPRLTAAQLLDISPSTHDYFKRIQTDHALPLVKVNVYKPNGSSHKIAGTYAVKDADFLVPKNMLQQIATNSNILQQVATNSNEPQQHDVATTLQHNATPNLQGIADNMQQKTNYLPPNATSSNIPQQPATTILPLPTTKPIIMSEFNGRNEVLEFKLNYTTDQNEALKKRVRELELSNENCMQENLKLLRTSTLAGDRHAFELEKQANQLMAESKSGLAGVGDLLSNNKDVLIELAGIVKDGIVQMRTTPAIAGVAEPLHNNPDASEAIRAINQQFKPLNPETIGKLYIITEHLIKNPGSLESYYATIVKPKATA